MERIEVLFSEKQDSRKLLDENPDTFWGTQRQTSSSEEHWIKLNMNKDIIKSVSNNIMSVILY